MSTSHEPSEAVKLANELEAIAGALSMLRDPATLERAVNGILDVARRVRSDPDLGPDALVPRGECEREMVAKVVAWLRAPQGMGGDQIRRMNDADAIEREFAPIHHGHEDGEA